MRTEAFEQAARSFLPGWLFGFNIADLKRRNAHLGFRQGDRDIAELGRLLGALAGDDALVQRVSGDRWLMIARHDMRPSVQSLLDRYRRSEPHATGWSISARRGDSPDVRICERVAATDVSRAVRCLFAEVATPADLAAALGQIAAHDHDVPVDRLVDLRDVARLAPTRWRCVSQYPVDDPVCPFCGGRSFDWHDGDGSVYSGDGQCRGCGAEISISQLDRSVA